MINGISIFFILYGLVAVVYKISIGEFWELFWGCYWGMMLIGVAGLRRNGNLVMAMVSSLFVPLVVWSVDWTYQAITGTPLLGISSFFFQQIIAIENIITYEHLLFVPMGIALLMALKQPPKSEAWQIGVVIITLGILLGYAAPAGTNVNCFYNGCGTGIHAPIWAWVIASYVMMFIGYFILNQILKWNTKKSVL